MPLGKPSEMKRKPLYFIHTGSPSPVRLALSHCGPFRFQPELEILRETVKKKLKPFRLV